MTGTTRAGTPRVATPPPGSPGRTPLPASPACWPGSAIRAAVVATLLATTLSIVPPLLRAESTEYPASRGTGPESAAPSGNSELPGDAAVDLQRQINDLRSDLLDERERRIVRLQEASGFAFGVLAALIGGGGLWAYAKFRTIATEARYGATVARAVAAGSPNLIPQAGAPLDSPGEVPWPLPRLLRAPPEVYPGAAPCDVGPNGPRAEHWSSNGHRLRDAAVYPGVPGSNPAIPQRPDPGTSGPGPGDADAEQERYEDVVADCTEAIRLSPDDPRLYLERGTALVGLHRHEEALADYDRAIELDSENAAAYLSRSVAYAELDRHDEALADYERLAQLDPGLAGTSI